MDMIFEKPGSFTELVNYFVCWTKWTSLDLIHKLKRAEVLLESEAEGC